MTEKHRIIGREESHHYKGSDRTHPFQKDGTDSASTLYQARQGGLRLLEKMREGQEAVASLITILKIRTRKEQTYLEMLRDWIELEKTKGLLHIHLSASPFKEKLSLSLSDKIVNGDDLREQIAQEIVDMLTAPEVPDPGLI